MMNMIKLKITKVINIVKLSRNSLISWIICNLFYNLTVLHTPCWLQKFHYYFWKFDGFLDMPKLLVFSFIKYTFALFCFSSNNRSEFSKHLLYSSLIDWFVAGHPSVHISGCQFYTVKICCQQLLTTILQGKFRILSSLVKM